MKHTLTLLALIAVCGTMMAQPAAHAKKASRSQNVATWLAKAPIFRAQATTPAQWETLIDENFDNLTGGTNEAPDYENELLVSLTHYVFNGKMNMDGWSGLGLHEAGGAVAVSQPGIGNALLNTPEMVMPGYLHLTFRAKALAEVKGFNVCLNYNGIGKPDQVTNLGGKVSATDNGWVDFEYYIYNPREDASYIQINCACYGTSEGLIVDDFKLERTTEYCRTTSDMECYDFTTNGFRATWAPVAKATSYLVSLYRETVTGNEPVITNVDFNGISEQDNQIANLPEGVSVNLRSDRSHFTADGGNNATPAIILAKENEWIEIDGGGSRITNLTFWYRGVTAPDDENERFMAVNIEGWDGCQWKHINDVQDNPTADSEGEIIDFGEYFDEYNEYAEEEGYDPISFRGMYTKIRIQPESMNYGVRVAIDDITIEAEPATTVETIVENQAVNANDYLFTNVDMTAKGVRYFVGVNAVNGQIISPEYVEEAFGVAAPVVLPATEINKDNRSFTANWEAIPNAAAYMVNVYDCQKMEADAEDFALITESFDNVHEEGVSTDPENPTSLGNTWAQAGFNNYTDNEGWLGIGNCAIEGALGCKATMFTGLNFLQSPVLTLNNNGGNYTIRTRAYIKEGDALMFTTTNIAATTEVAEVSDWYDLKIPMTGGAKQDMILIQSMGSKAFLLDNFSVTQDMKAGDLLLTMIAQNEVAGRTSQDFTDMPEGNIGYDVMAGREYYLNHAVSTPSATQIVDFDWATGLKGMTESHTVLTANGRVLTLTSQEPAEVKAYDMTGRLVAHTATAAGRHTITLPAAGIYAVSVNGKTTKIVVK